jgi:hypothetical protein
MNENFELEIAGKLYEQMFTTRAKTDFRLMELESFIVRHYGHNGTTLIRAIDERHSAGPVIISEQPKQGKQFRSFVHPDATKKSPPQRQVVATRKGEIKNAAAVAQPAAEPVIQNAAAPGGENPPLMSNEPPVVAVDGGDEKPATTNVAPITISPGAETTVTITDELIVDPADAKTMRAAVLGKKYGVAPLRKFLEERGVKYDGNPSVTQLAALAIQTINPTGK